MRIDSRVPPLRALEHLFHCLPLLQRNAKRLAAMIDGRATTIVLVRHGETTYNREGRLQGQRAEVPLNELGTYTGFLMHATIGNLWLVQYSLLRRSLHETLCNDLHVLSHQCRCSVQCCLQPWKSISLRIASKTICTCIHVPRHYASFIPSFYDC